MQTTAVLLDGYTVRPPEPDDAETIFNLVSAYNTALVGFADCTLDSIGDGIVEPGFDRGTDGWLVLAGDGLPVGYATAFGNGDREVAQIEVVSQHPAVAAWLFDRTMQRALEMSRERGHAELTVDAVVYRADELLRALMSDHDFTAGTTYQRMRNDHTGPVVARDAQSTFDWFQLTLLEIDGRAVAMRDCSDAFVEGENCGHGGLGVLGEVRGRGLEKFLLRDAFALDAATGRAGTILLVDTNNPTPALDLYLSVGMSPTLVFDGWRRILPVA